MSRLDDILFASLDRRRTVIVSEMAVEMLEEMRAFKDSGPELYEQFLRRATEALIVQLCNTPASRRPRRVAGPITGASS